MTKEWCEHAFRLKKFDKIEKYFISEVFFELSLLRIQAVALCLGWLL